MKLNKLFMVLAATAIVGCTSDDLNDFTANQAPEQDSRLIELNENFVIAGVGVEASATRTHWELVDGALKNKFLPTYATAGAAGDKLSDVAAPDVVGLCWLGQGAVGTDVYTNYQFYHFGWLNKGESEADVECGKLNNGAFYDAIELKAATVADDEAVPGTDWDKTTLPAEALDDDGEDNLNYNSGVYKTDNKSIFGGTYIVYYPFEEDFNEIGTIPAKATTVFNPAPVALTDKALGEATFRYSSPVTIEGGDQAAGFGMHNLSTLVQLRVATPSGVDLSAKNIDKVILYSASKGLLKQANLAADKIVAGNAADFASTEGTQTVAATFAPAVALKATDAGPTSAYITVLPTTVPDLKALVHNSTDGTWATVDLGSTTFGAGKAKRLDISVTAADFKSDFIAVDEATLTTALNEADAAITAGAESATITVIGDITLETAAYSIDPTTYPNIAEITISGDAIIVPEDVTLTLEDANIESEIQVLGKSCCDGAQGGRLVVKSGTISDVTMVETEANTKNDTNNPEVQFTTAAATVAAGSTFDVQAGKVIVSQPVAFKGDVVIAEGAKLTVDATGSFKSMGANVTNNGTIEVEKYGQYNMASADGTSATATDGKRMTNGETGVFIHNVDAGVGTAVQSMVQNGEYRCKVNSQNKLDDAYNLWTACSVIEMVEAGATYNLVNAKQHGGKYVDIEVSTTTLTTFNNPVVGATTDGDELAINIGNLTVTKGGLDIDYFTGTKGRTLTVNGDMVAKANTTITDSKKINVTKNLTVEGAGITLTYKGINKNVDGLAVTGDVTVSKATFDASDTDAIKISCANFYLADGAEAKFGNRTSGGSTTMAVTGTINNPKGCKFTSAAATGTNLLPHITCTTLLYGGTFTNYEPQTVE